MGKQPFAERGFWHFVGWHLTRGAMRRYPEAVRAREDRAAIAGPLMSRGAAIATLLLPPSATFAVAEWWANADKAVVGGATFAALWFSAFAASVWDDHRRAVEARNAAIAEATERLMLFNRRRARLSKHATRGYVLANGPEMSVDDEEHWASVAEGEMEGFTKGEPHLFANAHDLPEYRHPTLSRECAAGRVYAKANYLSALLKTLGPADVIVPERESWEGPGGWDGSIEQA